MSNELKMLLLITLPTVKSDVPFRAEIRLTKNSDIDVLIATIVNPMTIYGTFSRSATVTEPAVRRSASQRTSTIPEMVKRDSITYEYELWG
jgi:hypothetical protein